MPEAEDDDRAADEDPALAAAKSGDVDALAALVEERPDRLTLRAPPYGWTLLHLAASEGHLAAVDFLLRRGVDPNVKEHGDDTTAMHWAAARGSLSVVARLADAGGDVVGAGDDHELGVIGWATCWEGCDDAAHRAVADLLIARGARHHIFSAIALNLEDEVRALVARDRGTLAQRMSRNEVGQQPLHFAIRRNRPAMVSLLLELGADPHATDMAGMSASDYAAAPDVGIDVIQALDSGGVSGTFIALSLGREREAEQRWREAASDRAGTLHRVAKRGDLGAVHWLLARGADPNELWSHWGADVTPLHLAAAQGHAEVVRALLASGADPHLRDSLHEGDAAGWAEYGRVPAAEGWDEIVRILQSAGSR